MGVSEFFHIQSECERCGEKCHIEMQAKVPGSWMRNYVIGDKIADEVLEAFKNRESEYHTEVLGIEEGQIEKSKNELPSFTIVPNYRESHCKNCGRYDVERSISVVIEKGVFAKVLFDGQRKGSIMHRGLVIPELVLEDNELRGLMAKAITDYCNEEPFENSNKGNDATPCQYCGKPLRTSLAKQCFECHMDWHDPSNIVKHEVDENNKNKKNEEPYDKENANKAIREALGLDE